MAKLKSVIVQACACQYVCKNIIKIFDAGNARIASLKMVYLRSDIVNFNTWC